MKSQNILYYKNPIPNYVWFFIANASMAEMDIEADNSIAKTVAADASDMMAGVAKLSEAMTKHDVASTGEHMQLFANDIRGLMNEVRSHADTLETEVTDDLWPLPKYQEMLFIINYSL